MTYVYRCSACGHQFDVIKSVVDIDRPENCENCSCSAERIFVPNANKPMKTSVKDAYFDYGLGKVVKNERDKKDTLKQRDIIEVGSEKSEESYFKNTVVKKQIEKEKEWSDLQ